MYLIIADTCREYGVEFYLFGAYKTRKECIEYMTKYNETVARCKKEINDFVGTDEEQEKFIQELIIKEENIYYDFYEETFFEFKNLDFMSEYILDTDNCKKSPYYIGGYVE